MFLSSEIEKYSEKSAQIDKILQGLTTDHKPDSQVNSMSDVTFLTYVLCKISKLYYLHDTPKCQVVVAFFFLKIDI